MLPRLVKVFVLLAAGLFGAGILWALFVLAAPACSLLPLGLCPLPR
jgi:hypothetical protein